MVGRVAKFSKAGGKSEERVQRLQSILEEMDYQGFKYDLREMADCNGGSCISVTLEWSASDRDDPRRTRRLSYSPFYCTGPATGLFTTTATTRCATAAMTE